MTKLSKKLRTDPAINEKLTQGHGLKPVENDSSPSFGTTEASISREFEAFLANYQQVWQPSVTKKYPYKLAKLIHYGHDMTKRWHVEFYAWDVSVERLKRKRLFDPINRQKTVQKRLEWGNHIVRVVNTDLMAGKVLGRDVITKEIKFNIMTMTITQAIEFVRDEKKAGGHRKNYYRGFTSLVTNLKEWLEYEQQEDFYMKQLKQSDVFDFFRYLNQVKGIGNKTYNNYRNDLATAINFLLKREPRLFKVNPATAIDQLPVVVKKHAAFTDAQVMALKAKCVEKGYNQLLLFIQCIYYTLARPGELVQLKVTHIDLDLQRIFIPGEISKTKFDDYVGISDHLKKEIEQSGIMTYPPHYFVFGNKGVPGPVRWATSDPFWRKNQKILKELEYYQLNENYSLYSYKHSGAISLYLAFKDVKLIQRQCRHTTLEQTNNYLRDLGLISGLEGLNRWKGAV